MQAPYFSTEVDGNAVRYRSPRAMRMSRPVTRARWDWFVAGIITASLWFGCFWIAFG